MVRSLLTVDTTTTSVINLTISRHTRDEKTSCKEQQLKEQGKRQHNLQYLLKQTLKEGILED
jgi:hypothetical protein